MKTASQLVMVTCALCLTGCADAQQGFHINAMDKAGAISLASHLSYGMSEEDAVVFLKQNGLTNMASAGDSFSWSDCFSLSNRCSLCVTISPEQLSPDGAWVNGLVRKIYIYHWNGNTEPIVLINAP